MELDEISNKLLVVGLGREGALSEQAQYLLVVSKLVV